MELLVHLYGFFDGILHSKNKTNKSQTLDFILQKSSIKDAELGLFIQFILFQDFTNLKCLVKD